MGIFKKEEMTVENEKNVNSVAIIMDGNGRWAKRRGLPRSAGHKAGVKAISGVLTALRSLGVHHVTLYAFSTENWKRPKDEVNTLMDLAYNYLDTTVRRKIEEDKDFSVKFLGDKSPLPERLRNICIEMEKASAGRDFVCNVALNYGGRDEIVHAANLAIKDGHTNLTEEILSRYTYTYPSPDPEIVIRTGGDFRISNFLLWQSAYSEFFILDTLWPDFDKSDVERVISDFNKRQRRFGGLGPDDEKK